MARSPRNFTSPSGVTFHVYPWSRVEAIAHRRDMYVTEGHTCPKCGTKHPLTYVKDDSCYHCFANTLSNPQLACRKGPHEVIPDHRGSCAQCTEDAREWKWSDFRGRAMIPYTCSKCGNHTLLVMATGQCLGCLGVTPPIAPDNMSRSEAHGANYRLYRGGPCNRGHSGVRYVSTGSCVLCQNDPFGDRFPAPVTHAAIKKVIAVGMDRSTAHQLMFHKYMPTEPCIRGHMAPRYTASGQCVQCAADLQRKRQGRT